MADSLRDAVTAAFEQDESPDDPVVSDTTTETPAPDEAIEATADTSTEPAPPDQPDGERPRDALGRFLPAQQADGKGLVATPPEKAPTGLPAQPEGQPRKTFEPPPAEVPPGLRSDWTKLSPEWRQVMADMHQQRQQFEQQAQPAIQFAQRFMQAIAPHQQMIQTVPGINGDPIVAVSSLLSAESTLRYGTPGEKASLVADIVRKYGIGIEDLDGALVGIAPQQTNGADPMAIQRAVQQALAPLMSAAQQRQSEREQALGNEIAREIDTFKADPKNEYFEDVRNLMADVMEVANRNGEEVSVADAYERACLLHPEVRKIIVAKQNGASAQNLTQAAQRAKAAAVSVKGSGAVVGSPEPSEPLSVRAAIERAIETHSGRV